MSDTAVLTPPLPAANLGAPVAPAHEAAAAPVPDAESPPTLTRREPAGPVFVHFDSALPGVTSAEIRAELARRGKRIPKLLAEHALVLQQIEAIEGALASIGEDMPALDTAPREAKAPRARNAFSLKDVIAAAVQVGEAVGPAEVVERVRAGGYASTAANLGQMVASALAKDDRFRRIGRGRYERCVL